MKSIQMHTGLRVLNVAFDVGKDLLTWQSQPNDVEHSGSLGNSTAEISTLLPKLQRLAKKFAYDEVRVICESTGVYHRSLLQLAGQGGMRTAMVAGEAVAKMRTIESNDPNKSDEKDPATILAVAKIGKLLIHRQLDTLFAELRELHTVYKSCEDASTKSKTELQHALKAIFPDLRLSKDALYGPGGRRMLWLFHGNPVWIVACGSFEAFVAKMKKEKLRVQNKTLRHIWDAANRSVEQKVPPVVRHAQSIHIGHLTGDLEANERCLETLAEMLVRIYRALQTAVPHLPKAVPHVLTELMAARLIAETGPLSDFQTYRQLFRYAGLNLCERKSGKWKGKTKISRRGRSNLRHVLNLWAFSLVSTNRLYAKYYRRKRDIEKMPGTKALTCVMRKALKMLFGWYQSEQGFDSERVYTSKRNNRKAKANKQAIASIAI